MKKVKVGDWVKFTYLGLGYEGKLSLDKEYEVTNASLIRDEFEVQAEIIFTWIDPSLPKEHHEYAEYEIVNNIPRESKKKDKISVAASDYDFGFSCTYIINQMDKLTKEDQQDLLALLNHRYFRGSNA